MNLTDLQVFANILFEWDVARIGAFLIGLIVGGVAAWTVARKINRRLEMEESEALAQKWRLKRLTEQAQAQEASIAELQKEKEAKINELHEQMTELVKSAHTQAIEWQQASEELAQHRDDVQALTQQLEAERNEKQYLFEENRRLERDRDEMQQRHGQAATLMQQNAELQGAIRILQQRAEAEGQKAQQLAEQCERLQVALDEREFEPGNEELKQEAGQLREKIQLLTDMEGKIWERPTSFGTPPFRAARGQVAKIISVANLKSGVGKTTITANLGATLAQRGYRVLLVDLDAQASLTSLCLPPDKLVQASELDHFVRHILRAPHPDQAAWHNLTELTEPLAMHLLAADEPLSDDEERAKFAWVLEETDRDVRYVFRAALHSPRFQDKFDVILLDCPARTTTACVNALAASDFVMVPAQLDQASDDSIPRLLNWMEQLRVRKVCMNLSQAGIVANAGRKQDGDWIPAHQDALHQLQEHCRSGKLSVDLFEQVVPFQPEFAEAAERHTFAALSDALAPVFAQLVDELIARKAISESPRLAAVS